MFGICRIYRSSGNITGILQIYITHICTYYMHIVGILYDMLLFIFTSWYISIISQIYSTHMLVGIYQEYAIYIPNIYWHYLEGVSVYTTHASCFFVLVTNNFGEVAYFWIFSPWTGTKFRTPQCVLRCSVPHAGVLVTSLIVQTMFNSCGIHRMCTRKPLLNASDCCIPMGSPDRAANNRSANVRHISYLY